MTKSTTRSIIVSALLVIVLCVSLAVGATYAMFTGESQTNIVVKVANVNVAATANNLKLYSVQEADNSQEDDRTEAGTFTNGGTATIDSKEGTVTLDKLSAGDKVSFDIVVKNESNIDVKYRTVLKTAGSMNSDMVSIKTVALMLALNVTMQVDEGAVETYEGWNYESKWQKLSAEEYSSATLKTVHVTIGLPASVTDSSLMNSSLRISYKVEAVQGNTQTSDAADNEYRIYNVFDLMAFGLSVRNGNEYSGKVVRVMNTLSCTNYPIQPIGDSTHPFKGTFTGKTDGTKTKINQLTIANSDDYGTGLFYRLGDGAVVKDIYFEQSVVKSTSDTIDESNSSFSLHSNCVGAIAGYTEGAVTIQNVEIGDVYVYGFGKVGGLVGMNGSGSELTLNNVEVWGTYIRGAYDIGGLIGLSSGAPTISGYAKVSKDYTVARMLAKDSFATYVTINDTLSDTTQTINGTYFQKTVNGKNYLFAVKANLYNLYSTVDETTGKLAATENTYVGEGAIINNEGIINGSLSSDGNYYYIGTL